MKGISIITITEGNIDQLNTLLSSFLNINTFKSVEFIIIDFGAKNKRVDTLLRYSSEIFIRYIRCLKTKDILSSAKLAVSKAKYPNLFFVNPGVIFNKNILFTLAEQFKKYFFCGLGKTSDKKKSNPAKEPTNKTNALSNFYLKHFDQCIPFSFKFVTNCNDVIELARNETIYSSTFLPPLYSDSSQKNSDCLTSILLSTFFLCNKDEFKSVINDIYFFSKKFKISATINKGKKYSLKALEPNNKHAIWKAHQMMLNGKNEEGLNFAKSNANHFEKPAINILRANMDLDEDTLWLKHVNQYLRQFEIAPIDLLPTGQSRYLRITSKPSKIITEGPLVSVIMPAYNAEKTLPFAARSILNQTWQKLELIIVDDASTDNTWKVANNLAGRDYRVKILRNTVNVGPYVSKNYALRVANGDFITGQDSDDWAHPQRIEKHLQLHIAEGVNTKASLIGMLRIAENGSFTRISKVTSNCQDGVLNGAFISTLFEYQFLREIIGYWDEVRFAGDSEIIKRVELAQKASLARFHFMGLFLLDSPDSLTSDPIHGYSPERGLSTTRKKYRNSFTAWHKTLNPTNTFLSFPQTERKFFIPTEMSVNKKNIITCLHGHNDYINVGKGQYANISKIYREFCSDICILTDLRLPGGNASSTLDEIDFFLSINKKVLVIDCPSAVKAGATTSSRYNKYNSICELFYNIDLVKTDVLIIRAPAIIETERFQSLIKKIVSKKAIFVLNNSILTPKNKTVYSFSDLESSMSGLDAQSKRIFPLGPAIRNELMRLGHGKSKLLSSYDWPPTFNSESFPFNPKHRIAKPYVIGRHGRDGKEKWLEDKQQLRLAYPSNCSFQVKILGGAANAEKILSRLPENWTVYPFGSMEPREYLSKLDAFVYFPHSQLNEAFGRAIMEAIFAGVACILPHRFKETFENMAFFCEPAEVANIVERLSFHQKERINFLTLVRDFAVSNFDSKVLSKRIERLAIPEAETKEKNATSMILSPEIQRYVSWVEKGFL